MLRAQESTQTGGDILHQLKVRLITPEERPGWDDLIRAHHYLGLRCLGGRNLRYVAEWRGQWLALLGWQAAALKCHARDAWIGWPAHLQFQRLHLIANNARFLILPQVHLSHLASRLLALNLRRLSSDWQSAYGHPLLLAETFVDPARFRGTCYRAANWIFLGKTRGYAKSAQRYCFHNQPKQVWVYPLHRHARQWLASAQEQPCWRCPMNLRALSTRQLEDLHLRLRGLPDTRKPRGVRHRLSAVLTIAVGAVLCGAKAYTALAEYALSLSQDQLKRLGARYNRRTKRFEPPSEPTLRRVLQSANAEAIDQMLGQWLLGSTDLQDPVAVDGKTLRGARRPEGQVHLLSAFLQHEAITVAQRQVEAKTNEITQIKPLLETLPLQGRLVTADALHTQRETARWLVEEKKADYLLTAKQNQATLRDDIATLGTNDFSPSG
ncbi:MAG: ISAs1 family transposase [Verrucomicrobia bacterium]|nr:ISAs1 family transposase [Verrucomicrobiota bacterium]